MLAVHDARTTNLREAVQQLGKLVNRVRHVRTPLPLTQVRLKQTTRSSYYSTATQVVGNPPLAQLRRKNIRVGRH